MHRREPSVVSIKKADSHPSVLGMTLTWLAVFFLIYKAFVWWEAHKKPVAQVAPPTAVSSPSPVAASQANSAPTPVARAEPQATSHDGGQWSEGERTVTKCVGNGQITFTDKECPHGSQVSSVTVNTANVGTVAPRPSTTTTVQVVTPVVVQQPVSVAQLPVADTRSMECAALEARIKQIDAAARQPQSAAMQDMLTAEKRNARSRQFALHC